ncbi:MAG: ABC transporter permease subunit, partial [Chloroflexota bacterium]
MVAWTFARLTLREASRSRLLILALGLTALYVGLFAWGCEKILEHSKSLSGAQMAVAGIEVVAFYMGSFILALLAVFVAGASTHHDGETGLLQAQLARPVRRFDLLAGKWLGSAVLVGGYVAIFSAGLVFAGGLTSGYQPPHPVLAGGLLLLEALVVLSLRLLFGSFLGNMASGILPLMLYGLAWMGGLVEAAGRQLNIPAMVNGGIATSLLVPTDALWKGASYFLLPSFVSAASRSVGEGNPFIATAPIATPMVVWGILYAAAI